MILILMATYNGEKHLRAQLSSCLSQSFKEPFRILVSDDGSADSTLDIIKEFKDSFPEKVFLLPPREKNPDDAMHGAAANFFYLLQAAKALPDTEYVFFCDQDDVWMEEKLSSFISFFKSRESVFGAQVPMLVHSDMEVTDEKLSVMSDSFFSYSGTDPKKETLSELLLENSVTGGAMAINRALLDRTEIPGACFMHDWWVTLCAAAFGKIFFLPEPLHKYRQHGKNQLGATRTGSIKDLSSRLFRGRAVRESYEKIFGQAREFLRIYKKDLAPSQAETISGFLKLQAAGPIRRLLIMKKYGIKKSSPLQTAFLCFSPFGTGYSCQ